MTHATIEETARLLQVTTKTVREWIRVGGCPTVKSGARGAGNAALVDMARLPGWLDKHRGGEHESWADRYAEAYPGRNVLRDVALEFARCAISVAGQALAEWGRKPDQFGNLDHRKAGLTEQQARAVAAQVWGVMALAIAGLHDGAFESHVEREMGFDLDGLFSFAMRGDFRTPPKTIEFEIPAIIRELMPPQDLLKLGRKASRKRA